jgi:hypothetical protein
MSLALWHVKVRQFQLIPKFIIILLCRKLYHLQDKGTAKAGTGIKLINPSDKKNTTCVGLWKLKYHHRHNSLHYGTKTRSNVM